MSEYRLEFYITQDLFPLAVAAKRADSSKAYIDDYGYILPIKNQLVSIADIEYVNSFLLHEDGSAITMDDYTISAQAYAAPIYDKNSDSLKIGLGSYKKDGNGNITEFTFGAGQGQSIATRDDAIPNNSVLF
jgi:hypothetical protein